MDKGKKAAAGIAPSPIATFRLAELNEPKTLFHDEIDRARKAALEVIRNNSHEEAALIFQQAMEGTSKMEKKLKQGLIDRQRL